jgi:hypothetical protein
MKKLFLLLLLCSPFVPFAQHGYPTPPTATSRLFYIQHSNNHNTFVYDANMASGKLNTAEPVDVYCLKYKDGGGKEALSPVQRKMAYGVELLSTQSAQCEFTLAAYPSKKLVLKLGKDGKPYVTTSVNGKSLVLHKLFLKMGKLPSTVLYIDFYGTDAVTGKEITERHFVK